MKLCGFETGGRRPFFLIAGPCVIESEAMVMEIAGFMKEVTGRLGIPYIFKASFDKANRTSDTSFRGLGMAEGLRILAQVREKIGVPVLTDVHTEAEVPEVAAVVDVLQTPAFLCRQTDFIRACAKSGKPVNIKKGQFLAPHDMVNVVAKARHAAEEAGLDPDRFCVCERGASFGYGNLVSDMRSLAIMRETKAPVVFDATQTYEENILNLLQSRDHVTRKEVEQFLGCSAFPATNALNSLIQQGKIVKTGTARGTRYILVD